MEPVTILEDKKRTHIIQFKPKKKEDWINRIVDTLRAQGDIKTVKKDYFNK